MLTFINIDITEKLFTYYEGFKLITIQGCENYVSYVLLKKMLLAFKFNFMLCHRFTLILLY